MEGHAVLIKHRKIVIMKSHFPGHWAVHAPIGMRFEPDESIGRSMAASSRVLESFDLARQYVADGRAQRSLEPAP